MATFDVLPENHNVFDEFETDKFKSNASRGQRFANYIIDFFIFYLFVILIGALFGILLGLFSPSSLNVLNQENPFSEYLIGFVLGTIYFTGIEFLTKGRSVGKLITKTKVITSDGEAPEFKHFLIRSLCRFIPFEPFSFFGSDASGWHDSISKTRVVKVD